MPETYNPQQAVQEQKKFCEERNLTYFAPVDGVCWRCYQNIYQRIKHGSNVTGISVERAGSELVTGCPHCYRSFCD